VSGRDGVHPFIDRLAGEIAAELMDGRFTINKVEPLVEVAWRVTGRRPQLTTKEEK
jgi:hypothetical protein